jgi:GTP-binding protein Era
MNITKCGFVAIIGKPNVGKSTLMNGLIGEKVSITANKPQTTRHKMLGVKTWDKMQIVFVDTPGIHSYQKKVMNRLMNKEAKAALEDLDLALVVIEAKNFNDEDLQVLQLLDRISCPVILVINKIDKLQRKDELLPVIERISKEYKFTEIVPVVAIKYEDLNPLLRVIEKYIPYGHFHFAEDSKTDKDLNYRLAEIIREKLTRRLDQELPYAITVGIEKYEKKENVTVIHAVIWVERKNQKSIVIGKQGSQIKEVGILSREDMEKILKTKVHLELWVKVRTDWSEDQTALSSIGLFDH